MGVSFHWRGLTALGRYGMIRAGHAPMETHMNGTAMTFRGEVERIANGLTRVIDALDKIGGAAEALRDHAESHPAITPAELGFALFHLKELYEQADKQIKRVYHIKDAIDKAVLPNRMRDNGIDGFKIPEIARSFSIVEKTSASFIDKESGLNWLRGIGQGDMVQETVNAGTLSAFCRNLVLEQGIDPPPDIVKMNTYSTTSMVKYRPK